MTILYAIQNRTFTQPPIEQLLRPIQRFVKAEASSGILLVICAVVALVWANSAWADSYHNLWQTKFTISVGSYVLSKSLILWINDGLMAIFFFVVGLEIKREILVGELSSPRLAALPIAAAIGGMVLPAMLYLAFNVGQPGAVGWGIPVATDIAFALGIMSLLGKRVPLSLKVFLTAVAIVDDIGAILVITLFYTSKLSWMSLAVGAGFLIALFLSNRAGIYHPTIYAILGIGLWLALLKSGVHATIAGVLLAMMIPSRPRINVEGFLADSHLSLKEFERYAATKTDTLTNRHQWTVLQSLESACRQVVSPLQRMEHALHPWSAYVIIPVFALANAGVALDRGVFTAYTSPITLGTMVGLIVGKQLGILLTVWLMVEHGLAAKPEGVSWQQIYGVGWLAGIGFTMSLFIANSAFGDTPLLTMAKAGILAASLISAVVGWIILRGAKPTQLPEYAPEGALFGVQLPHAVSPNSGF